MLLYDEAGQATVPPLYTWDLSISPAGVQLVVSFWLYGLHIGAADVATPNVRIAAVMRRPSPQAWPALSPGEGFGAVNATLLSSCPPLIVLNLELTELVAEGCAGAAPGGSFELYVYIKMLANNMVGLGSRGTLQVGVSLMGDRLATCTGR